MKLSFIRKLIISNIIYGGLIVALMCVTSRVWVVSIGVMTLALVSILPYLILMELRSNVARAVVRLKACIKENSAASEELVDASHQLSKSSQKEAGAIQSTVATLNQINAMVSKSLDNANRSAKVASSSQTSALEGKRFVGQMITAIEEINKSNDSVMTQVEESNTQINEIIRIISEIGNKTEVINDIVFQTKLLSFNASVEAARAGEHGKGFAVVAEEVGNLAQMSGNSAREISDMLQASMQKAEGIARQTKEKVQNLTLLGKGKVEAGTAIARECGSSLEEIVRTVSEVNEMMDQISKAAEEQAKGVSEITKSMEQLDESAHFNSNMSQKTATHSSQLSKQSEQLSDIVTEIQTEVLGIGASESSRMPENNSRRNNSSIKLVVNNLPQGSVDRHITPKKVAAVGGQSLPSGDDPRFQDV